MAPQSRGSASSRPSLITSQSTPNFSTLSPRLSASSNEEANQPTPTATTFSQTPGLPLSPDGTDVQDEDDASFHGFTLDDQLDASGSSDDDVPPLDHTQVAERRPSRSNIYPFNNTFAPPFYNRPPTPLPPSPSLTSLLRPPFSATASRPTTPDSSDQETPNDTEAVVAKSARTATTVPRASPKVPTYEYYGFVLYLVSTMVFRPLSCPSNIVHEPPLTLPVSIVIYLLWSYLPSPFLHQLGIYYYPNRWWSLAIPAYLAMLIIYIYVALACYNTDYLTLPMESIENMVDEAANVAVLDSRGRIRRGGSDVRKGTGGLGAHGGAGSGKVKPFPPHPRWKEAWNIGTDAVMDVPIGAVCEILYGEGSEDDASEIGEVLHTQTNGRAMNGRANQRA